MTREKDTPDQKIREALAAGRARQEIASLPEESLLDALLEAPDPGALVRAFPEEDFYFLVHRIGAEDSLPILAAASDAQWEYLLDQEAWDQDRLDLDQTQKWLKLLAEADSPRLARWLLEKKNDLLDLYLFRTVELRIREHDQDPSDFGDDFSTFDGVYYFRARPPLGPPETVEARQQEREELLSRLLEKIAGVDHFLYQHQLLEAHGLIPAEVEEEAYRLRNVRLAERGFLPPEEAVGVYQRLKKEDLLRRGRKRLLRAPEVVSQLPVPQFVEGHLPDESLFARALAAIGSVAVLYQLQAEFAGLCNQIVSADRTAIREPAALKSVVAKAAGYLSIGLEHLTAGENTDPVAGAARWIEAHLLIDIFRVGFGLAIELKWRVQRWKEKSWFEAVAGLPLSFWDEAWMGVLGGLLLPRPLFYDNYRTGSLYREFCTLADIRETEAELDKVVRMDRLLADLGIDPETQPPPILTYKSLLLTLWAGNRAGLCDPAERPTLAPSLPLKDLAELHRELFPSAPPNDVTRPRRIADPSKTAFLKWLARQTGQEAAELGEALGDVFEALFSELESELGAVSAEDLDPRFVRLFHVAS